MNNKRFKTTAWGVDEPGQNFKQFEISRRMPGHNDVHIAIKYSGICHSDIHQANGDWNKSKYPMIPGHEIAGVVVFIGKMLKNLK